jgi:hypothetical protein
VRSAAEYLVKLQDQLDALERRLDTLGHRAFENDQAIVLLRFLKRAYTLGRASFLSADARLPVPVFVLARVLCEDLIRVHWISLSTANADTYVKRALGDIAKIASVNIERGRATLLRKSTSKVLPRDELNKILMEFRQRVVKGPTIEQMAQQCGLTKVYDIAYRFGSLEAHGTMPGLSLLAESDENGMVSQLPAVTAILRAILVVVDNRLEGHDTNSRTDSRNP